MGLQLDFRRRSPSVIHSLKCYCDIGGVVGRSGGGDGRRIVNVETKNVSLIDGPSFLREAMSSRPGEKAFLNSIRANRSALG